MIFRGSLILFAMLVAGGGKLSRLSAVPPYSLSAGFVGLILVGAMAFSISRFGLIQTSLIMVGAQLASAALIDHYGLLGAVIRPLDSTKLGGIGVMMLGVWLTIK